MKNFDQEKFNDFIIENNIIGFFNEPIKLKSGRISNFYVNWRNVTEDTFLLDKLCDFIIEFVKDKNLNPDCFYGVPEGATKTGILTQYKWAMQSGDFTKGSHILPMGRAKPKEHGAPKDKFFVGMPKGKVLVIEDVTTTGGSLLENLQKLKEADIDVVGVVSLTNRGEIRDDGKSVKEAVEKLRIPYYSMSDAVQLIPRAAEKLDITKEQLNQVKEYYDKYGVEKLNISQKSLNSIDRLIEKIDEKQNPCVVGLDPDIEKIPGFLFKGDNLEDAAEAIKKFNFEIIDAVHDLVPAVKPQIAFYEKYGLPGIKAFKETVDYAKSKDLIVIEDGKRNDIANTAKAYSDGHLGEVMIKENKISPLDLDFLTVTPYLGSDGIEPFVNTCEKHGKGIFILVKTSNKSSGDFQDRLTEVNTEEKLQLQDSGESLIDKTPLYNLVGLKVNNYAQGLKGKKGYSPIGAVVGATYPEQAEILRKIMPDSFFLVPGYGAQGASGKDITNCFNDDGYGAIINSSRGIIFAYKKLGLSEEKFAEAARQATLNMIKDINSALREVNKLPVKWRN